MQRTHNKRAVYQLFASLIIIGLAAWVFLSRQLIVDQINVWRFTPSAATQQLATRSAMSDKGRFLFYASSPELLGREPFNQACKSVATEQTAVLGCYTTGRIYVFDIENQKLDGIKEVTAAHEMLHAAYERLSVSEKSRVDALLSKQELGADKARIDELMAGYAKSEPGEEMNELHSILGTEVASLSPELEAYYRNYFTDRAKVTTLAKQYMSVFDQIKQQQDELVSSLNSLADMIDAKVADYKTASADLNSDISSFNTRASSGTMTRQEFDTERAALVRRQSSLKAMYDEIQTLVAQYDDKKKQLEAVNLESTTLNRSINSSLPDVKEIQ